MHQKELSVAYAADNNYAMLAGISMISLFENNKECSEISVYILADKIEAYNREKLCAIGEIYKRHVCIVDVADMLLSLSEQGIKGYENATSTGKYTAFARLLIPYLFLEKERLIYLDCDTLVTGDISELNTVDMCGRPIGLAYDCCQNRYKKYINLDENRGYFNTGVMVFDTKLWIKEHCTERIAQHMRDVQSEYPLVDQDFINVVLGNEIYTLGMDYNFLSQYFLYDYDGLKKVYDLKESYFYEEKIFEKDAKILHFCGQTFIRPWYINSRHPAKKIYDKYYGLSPWKDMKQKRFDWQLPYKVQYLLWRYFPKRGAVWCGKLMQRIFMKSTYGV